MDELANLARREAERVVRNVAQTRFAIVSSYDPSAYACKVRLQPEDVETGWCPLASIRVGNGFGIYTPPRIGDMAVVAFQEGGAETPVIMGFVYNDEDRPKSVPSGEIHVVHEDGAKVILRAGGIAEVYGTDVRLGPDGGTLRRLIDERLIATFNGHVHGNSGPPTPQLSLANHATAITKAG